MKKCIFSLSMLLGISLGCFCPSTYAMYNAPITNVASNKTWASTCLVGGLWLAWTLGPVIKGLMYDDNSEKEAIAKELTKRTYETETYWRANTIVQETAEKMAMNDVFVRCIVSDAPFTKNLPGATFFDLDSFNNEQCSYTIRNIFSSYAIILGEDFFKKVSKEELSFVISHELAHIKNNDLLVKLKRKLVLLGILGLCGALIIPSVIHSNNSMGAKVLLGLYGFLFSKSLLDSVDNYFSLQEEKRADLIAVATVGTSDGAVKFFERVRQENLLLAQEAKNGTIKDQTEIQLIESCIDGDGNDVSESTHPLLTERVAYCKAACPL